MAEAEDFYGTKVALINNGKVLAILRDDKPDIDFPGMWDLPGGARELGETPMRVAEREIQEELGIDLVPDEILWQKTYPAVARPHRKSIFMVFEITDEQIQSVIFGDEGQEWKMMPWQDFISDTNAVPGMQIRLQDYLVFAKLLR